MAKPTNPKTRRLLTEMAYKFACDEATRWVRRHAYMTPTRLLDVVACRDHVCISQAPRPGCL